MWCSFVVGVVPYSPTNAGRRPGDSGRIRGRGQVAWDLNDNSMVSFVVGSLFLCDLKANVLPSSTIPNIWNQPNIFLRPEAWVPKIFSVLFPRLQCDYQSPGKYRFISSRCAQSRSLFACRLSISKFHIRFKSYRRCLCFYRQFHSFSQDGTMTLVLRRLEEPPADTNGLTAYRPRNCLFPNRGLAFPFCVNFSPEFNLKSSNIGATNLFLDVHDLKIIWFLCRSQSSPAMLAMWGVSATTGWSRQQRCRLPKAALVVKKRPVSFFAYVWSEGTAACPSSTLARRRLLSSTPTHATL